MKLGVITSLWAYAEQLSIEKSLERIADLGLRYVDILGILHGDPLKLSTDEKKRIRRKLQTLDMIPGSLVLVPPGNIANQDLAEREKCWKYVKAGIEMIADIGGNQVLLNGGRREIQTRRPDARDNAREFLRRAADYAVDLEIFITLEAEPYVYFLVNDLDTTLTTVKELDHPNLKAVLDVGHLHLSRDAPEILLPIKPWTMRVHLSENDGFLHANDIIGTRTVPTGDYLSYFEKNDFQETCRKLGLDLVVTMELGVLGDNIPDPDEYARHSLNNVLGIAPFLES